MAKQIANESVRKNAHGGYTVGYGKPPVHTRFRKGQSGNPGGRPPGTSLVRAKALALEEAYRTVTVKEGRDTVALPAIQAIMRRQIALAARGNGPAQRAVIAAVLAIEEEEVRLAAEQRAREVEANKPIDTIEAARRVCFLIGLASKEEETIAAMEVRAEALAASGALDEGIEPEGPVGG
jgi:hypothetical protein